MVKQMKTQKTNGEKRKNSGRFTLGPRTPVGDSVRGLPDFFSPLFFYTLLHHRLPTPTSAGRHGLRRPLGPSVRGHLRWGSPTFSTTDFGSPPGLRSCCLEAPRLLFSFLSTDFGRSPLGLRNTSSSWLEAFDCQGGRGQEGRVRRVGACRVGACRVGARRVSVQ